MPLSKSARYTYVGAFVFMGAVLMLALYFLLIPVEAAKLWAIVLVSVVGGRVGWVVSAPVMRAFEKEIDSW